MIGDRETPGYARDLRSGASAAGLPAQATLAACVEAISGGDHGALGDLYDATAEPVYLLAKRILRDGREAEEALIEVYDYVWERAANYDPRRGSVEAWLMTITRGRALDRARSRAARNRREQALGPTTAGFVDPLGDAEARLVAAEESRALARALRSLAERERVVIELAFLRGATHPEIAHRTGLPLGTIKSQIRRGLAKLQQLLETPEAER